MTARAPADATTIELVKNGPYRVSGACRVRNARGEDVPARGRFELCRCGSSSNKPFCDDTHA
ncbi:MAG: CDGSH iron-sulfur domain-containing protein, partial [Burkholderiales bacterium]